LLFPYDVVQISYFRGRVTLAADLQKTLGCEGIGSFPPVLLLRIGFAGELPEESMKLNYSQNELVNLGLGIADGLMDEKDIKQWIKKDIV
jgi:hypothetical protein